MFKDAIRSLRRTPGLIALAVVSLSLGIGANTAIFSLVDQLVLRPLPVRSPNELVQLAARGAFPGNTSGRATLSYAMYRDFRDADEVFAGVICRYGLSANLGYQGQTARITAELVSGNYFPVLGVGAEVGRALGPDDDVHPGGHPVIMLSHGFWQTRFGGNRGVVGSTILLNNQAMTVVGVAQRGFHGVDVGTRSDVFVPMMMFRLVNPMFAKDFNLESRRSRWVTAFARLKPGVPLERAEAAAGARYQQMTGEELRSAAFQGLTNRQRERYLASRLRLLPGASGMSALRATYSTPLYVLMALTVLVLLIACANVANLLLARAAARRKEMAVRLSLGSGRGRIAGQLLVEGAILAAVAAAAGVAISFVLLRVLLAAYSGGESSGEPAAFDAAPDPRVLVFTGAVSLATALLFGLAPALHAARASVMETLKHASGAVAGGGAQSLVRKSLVTSQIALSLLLLIAAGLFVRSLSNLRGLDPGFRVDRLMTFSVDPRGNGYDEDRTRLFYRQLAERLRALPGVDSAGYSIMRLLAGQEWYSAISVEGYERQPGDSLTPSMNFVSPGYLAALGAKVVAGRDFSERDQMDTAPVCIVNQAFARKYFPGGNAVGRRIGITRARDDIEIAGVVADLRYEGLRGEIPRQVFLPFEQVPYVMRVTYYVRTALAPEQFYGSLRGLAGEIDPNVPVYEMRTLDQQVERALTTERLIAGLSAAFAVLATLLSVIGLYGVMAYTVARRSHEIGIRMALGAGPERIAAMVVREAAWLVAIGIAVALPVYFGLARYLRSQLFGISTADAPVIGAATCFIAVVAVTAGLFPARRAGKVDPIRVLRHD